MEWLNAKLSLVHAYIWQLDTRSADRYRGNCSAIAHNHFLAHKYQAPLIRLYITPSTVRFCDAVMAKETQQTREARDLILVDDDTPPPVVARLTAAYPTSVRLVKGYSPDLAKPLDAWLGRETGQRTAALVELAMATLGELLASTRVQAHQATEAYFTERYTTREQSESLAGRLDRLRLHIDRLEAKVNRHWQQDIPD